MNSRAFLCFLETESDDLKLTFVMTRYDRKSQVRRFGGVVQLIRRPTTTEQKMINSKLETSYQLGLD